MSQTNQFQTGNNDRYVYFQFSKVQMELRTKSEAKLGKKYFPGEVIVRGIPKLYTEVSYVRKSNDNDVILVAEGVFSSFKHKKPYSE